MTLLSRRHQISLQHHREQLPRPYSPPSGPCSPPSKVGLGPSASPGPPAAWATYASSDPQFPSSSVTPPSKVGLGPSASPGPPAAWATYASSDPQFPSSSVRRPQQNQGLPLARPSRSWPDQSCSTNPGRRISPRSPPRSTGNLYPLKRSHGPDTFESDPSRSDGRGIGFWGAPSTGQTVVPRSLD
ncbi:merozoite surface protein CMZ-8-like [Cajanus cajan]|uniref:merozoite surface protein CMZ-8-like n=1 Tax=Cajanus cajan TaxID=3821 RepID=UPI00098D8C70|nr:merozoite surface protein CMZ-8-like [Cajanus cajan]